jgi:hypothetical protein
MRIKALMAGAAIGLAVSMAAVSAGAAELLTNGSFETGDFSGWSWTGNTGETQITCGGGAEAGSCYVLEGPVGSAGVLSQTFTDNPGDTLTISGWISGVNQGPSQVAYYLDGTLLFDTADPVPAGGWTNYTVTATATGTDTFSVSFYNDPSFDKLDNFSVASTAAAVPEPASWALMIGGFFGLGATLRGARRRAAVTAA